jgi:ABC-type ATPase involved in cell division
MHLFRSLNDMGTAVVLATHSQDLLRRHAFPILQMEGGHLFQPHGLALAAAD